MTASSDAARLPRLHVVTDDDVLSADDFETRAAAMLAAGGADLALHLRGRQTTAARLHELTLRLLPRARDAGARLLVNDRVDVALTAHADGAQLPAHGLTAVVARRILGDAALIGVSRHARAPAAHHEDDAAADFVVFGSVYATRSHPGTAPAGIEGLRRTTASGALPIIAIGGITAARVGEVLAAGAHGVAVLSAVWAESDPRAAVAALLRSSG